MRRTRKAHLETIRALREAKKSQEVPISEDDVQHVKVAYKESNSSQKRDDSSEEIVVKVKYTQQRTADADRTDKGIHIKTSSTKAGNRNFANYAFKLSVIVIALLVFSIIMFRSKNTAARSDVGVSELSAIKEISVEKGKLNMVFVKGNGTTIPDFYISESEMTRGMWYEVTGRYPTKEIYVSDEYPATNVSWNDIQKFIRELYLCTGQKFRLPTEAEWVYAAKGGVNNDPYKYAGGDDLDLVAWNKNNATRSHPVKTKQPNSLGLYDMSGNVMEWCQDWYNSKYKVGRGGAWKGNTDYCSLSGKRAYDAPTAKYDYLGFRLVMDVK